METGDGNSGQVAAISSTASFKSPAGSIGMNDDDTNGEKQVKSGTLFFFIFIFICDQSKEKNAKKEEIYIIWLMVFIPIFTVHNFQTKKKRKRCGECIGCQKKDNCGDCAPCRNDKSHQICKQRRCEKLTDKKVSTRCFSNGFSFTYIYISVGQQSNVGRHTMTLQQSSFLRDFLFLN